MAWQAWGEYLMASIATTLQCSARPASSSSSSSNSLCFLLVKSYQRLVRDELDNCLESYLDQELRQSKAAQLQSRKARSPTRCAGRDRHRKLRSLPIALQTRGRVQIFLHQMPCTRNRLGENMAFILALSLPGQSRFGLSGAVFHGDQSASTSPIWQSPATK